MSKQTVHIKCVVKDVWFSICRTLCSLSKVKQWNHSRQVKWAEWEECSLCPKHVPFCVTYVHRPTIHWTGSVCQAPCQLFPCALFIHANGKREPSIITS